ncbi:MAG: hypothetical protein IPK39_16760 [Sulfuritalea sp.]|nr:hypothetical protein [Sulfuritalea sp.]
MLKVFIKGAAMALRARDLVPISEARARLTELVEKSLMAALKHQRQLTDGVEP